jgi:hypothetical protein
MTPFRGIRFPLRVMVDPIRADIDRKIFSAIMMKSKSDFG